MLFRSVVRSGLPNYRYGLSPTRFRLDFAPIERIFLPLATNGEQVDVILSMVIYLARPDEPEPVADRD